MNEITIYRGFKKNFKNLEKFQRKVKVFRQYV